MTRLLLFIVISLSLLAACSTETTSFGSAPDPRAASPTIVRPDVPPTAEDAAPVVATPNDIPALVESLRIAVTSNDLTRVNPLMLDTVFLAREGNEADGQSIERSEVAMWLKDHLSGRPVLDGADYVRDSGLLVVTTTGWSTRDPLQEGTILFQLHRYDPDGTMDDASGTWKVDTILYR